jgi:hypothetical protein
MFWTWRREKSQRRWQESNPGDSSHSHSLHWLSCICCNYVAVDVSLLHCVIPEWSTLSINLESSSNVHAFYSFISYSEQNRQSHWKQLRSLHRKFFEILQYFKIKKKKAVHRKIIRCANCSKECSTRHEEKEETKWNDDVRSFFFFFFLCVFLCEFLRLECTSAYSRNFTHLDVSLFWCLYNLCEVVLLRKHEPSRVPAIKSPIKTVKL